MTGAWGRGIVVAGTGTGRVSISDSTIDNCGNHGIYLTTGNATVAHCTISSNQNGFMGDQVDDVAITSCQVNDNRPHGELFVYSSRWHVLDCRCWHNGIETGVGP